MELRRSLERKWTLSFLATAGVLAAMMVIDSSRLLPVSAVGKSDEVADLEGRRALAVAPKAIEPKVIEPKRLMAEVSARQSAIADFITWRYGVARPEALLHVQLAYKAAARRGIDPLLIIAMMGVESGFNAGAVSVAGARGLMQIIPEFHPEKFDSNDPAALFDPQTNIFVGAHIFKEYLVEAKDTTVALQRYAGALADREAVYARRVLDELDRISEAINGGHRPI